MLRSILGGIAILFSPLSSDPLSKLLHITKLRLGQALNNLHAILDIPKAQTQPIRLHHPSFHDFLLDKDKCGDFWVNEKEAHWTLVAKCIRLMSDSLKQDICSMGAPNTLVINMESSRVEQCLPPEAQYACLY